MCKIMIVEDDQHIRSLFKQVLVSKGFDVIDVEDGEKAIFVYERLLKKPEIIIVDYQIDKINGIKLTKEILAKNPASKILMVSGDPRINLKGVSELGIRFKAKPISIEDLISEVDLLKNQLKSTTIPSGSSQDRVKSKKTFLENELHFMTYL